MQRCSSMGSDLNRPVSPGSWHREFSDTCSIKVDGDKWFEEVRRRFDERRRKWDEDIRRMRQEFFNPDHLGRSPSPPMLYVPKTKYSYSKPFPGNVEFTGDGSSFFTAKFDLKGYSPEQIRVSIRDNEVIVRAKTEEILDQGKSSREYSRAMKLPEGAIESMADAALSPDGLLIFTCPLQALSREECIHVRSASNPRTTDSFGSPSSSWKQRHQTDPHGRLDRSIPSFSKRKFCLELPIGLDYTPAEITIRTLNRRIHVTAKHEEHASNRTTVREFSKEYDLPNDVEPESLRARMEGGIVYIEET